LDSDEIDLGELFWTLWAHKLLIVVLTSLGVVGSGYYALTADKEYSASAVFSIDSGQSKGFSLGGELGGLAALAGINAGGQGGPAATLERVKRREFILEANDALKFENDPDFNTYNADAVDPLWKRLIKRAIGWQKSQQAKDAIVEQNILKNYGARVKLSETESGALQLTVINSDPEAAARYANTLMNMVAALVDREREQANADRLAYLSDILAKSLSDVEKSQEDLANFSMKNGVSPEQNLISESSTLDRMRREKLDAEAFIGAITALRTMVDAGETSPASFARLRMEHPVVDDVRFRRIVGLSETINSWEWPSKASLAQVSSTLSNRLKRLQVELNELVNRAADTADRVEELADLKRKATIAEATYRVMIEQVKAQTLSTGYKPETFKVYEYAVPPITPSAPKRSLIVALGLVLGLFLGAALALVLGIRRGVHFSRTALERDVDAKTAVMFRGLRRLTRLKFDEAKARLTLGSPLELEEATVQLANEQLVLVSNLGVHTTSANIAALLAIAAEKAGRRVLLCDTAAPSRKNKSDQDVSADYGITAVASNIDMLDLSAQARVGNLYIRPDFVTQLKNQLNNYDQVIVAGRDNFSRMAAHALSDLNPALVIAAQVGKTKKSEIAKLREVSSVKVLIYE